MMELCQEISFFVRSHRLQEIPPRVPPPVPICMGCVAANLLPQAEIVQAGTDCDVLWHKKRGPPEWGESDVGGNHRRFYYGVALE